MTKRIFGVASIVFVVGCSGAEAPAVDDGTNQSGLNGDGKGSTTPGKEENPGKGEPNPGHCNPDPKACTTLAFEASACKGVIDTNVLSKMCGAQGLELSSIGFETKSCTLTCCKPSPPAASCFPDKIADGTCLSHAEIKDRANAICLSRKAVLTQIVAIDSCPGGATASEIQCCVSTTPGEPPTPGEPKPGEPKPGEPKPGEPKPGEPGWPPPK